MDKLIRKISKVIGLNNDQANQSLSDFYVLLFLLSWFLSLLASCWASSFSASIFLAFYLKMVSIKTVLFLNWLPLAAR
jgi:hypothetical protein